MASRDDIYQQIINLDTTNDAAIANILSSIKTEYKNFEAYIVATHKHFKNESISTKGGKQKLTGGAPDVLASIMICAVVGTLAFLSFANQAEAAVRRKMLRTLAVFKGDYHIQSDHHSGGKSRRKTQRKSRK